MELGTKICFVTSRTYLDLYTTSIYKQTYVTSDTGIQNVMTSTSLKIKISRLNNAIEYKWLFVQTTKNSKYNPSPDNISPSVQFFSLNTELIYPWFRTVRSSIFYFLKRVLKNVTWSLTKPVFNMKLSCLTFFFSF